MSATQFTETTAPAPPHKATNGKAPGASVASQNNGSDALRQSVGASARVGKKRAAPASPIVAGAAPSPEKPAARATKLRPSEANGRAKEAAKLRLFEANGRAREAGAAIAPARDALMLGLCQMLPPAGATWTLDEAEIWLQAAASTLKLAHPFAGTLTITRAQVGA